MSRWLDPNMPRVPVPMYWTRASFGSIVIGRGGAPCLYTQVSSDWLPMATPGWPRPIVMTAGS